MDTGFSVGQHLILDIYTEINNYKLISMRNTMLQLTQTIEDSGLTIIGNRYHHFGDGFGFTGVIILSESHFSIHTWPEHGFCAIDLFACGDHDIQKIGDKFIEYFEAASSSCQLIKRGNIVLAPN
jgi:S-adenosylmethionine decarboxylase